MARLKGLTRNQLTILAIGCGDSPEGPFISMPDGERVLVKASQLTWMARQIHKLEAGEEPEQAEPDPEPVVDEFGGQA